MSQLVFNGVVEVDEAPYESHGRAYCWVARYSDERRLFKNRYLACGVRTEIVEKFSSLVEGDLISIRGHLGTVWAETEKERLCLFVTDLHWVTEE